MTYDPSHQQILLLGSNRGQSETWTWDGTTWTQQQPPKSPEPVADAAMAFDPSRRAVVLFGGWRQGAPSTGQTWTWNGSTWARFRAGPGSTAAPEGRELAAFAYDPVLDGLVLYGGVETRGGVSATSQVAGGNIWLWTGDAWQRQPSGTQTGAPAAPNTGTAASSLVPPLGEILLTGVGNDGHWQQLVWRDGRWRPLRSAVVPHIPTGTATAASSASTPATLGTLSTASAFDEASGRLVAVLSDPSGRSQTWLGTAAAAANRKARVDQHLVKLVGSIGSLLLGKASQAEVIKVAGLPEVETDMRQVVPAYPPSRALGYDCKVSVSATSGLTPLGTPSNHLGCMTVYWINATTGVLGSFSTASPAFHTPAGTHPGMNQAKASRLEGRPAVIGCMSGIFESGRGATLDLENRGGKVPQTSAGQTRTANLVGGVVSMLTLEAKRSGVGIQFC